MSLVSPTKTYHHNVYDAINPTNPHLSVAGKTVLITGGGQGIGVSFAKAFSLAGAANIVLLGRKLNTLNETKAAVEALSTNKSKVYTFQADVTDKTAIDTTFAKVANEIGKIDIYIANAGYLASPAPAATASIDDLTTSLSINVTGNLIAAQAFLRHRADKATLVAINSGAATMYYIGPMPAYVASKAAAARLFDQIAAENPDVRVFNLQPGMIKSAMSEKAGMSEMANDEPELPAAAAVYLSSSEAEFLRGRFLWSNWDVTELKTMQAEIENTTMWGQVGLVGWDSFQHKIKAPWE